MTSFGGHFSESRLRTASKARLLIRVFPIGRQARGVVNPGGLKSETGKAGNAQ